MHIFSGDSLSFLKWVLRSGGYHEDFEWANVKKGEYDRDLNSAFYRFVAEVFKAGRNAGMAEAKKSVI